MRRALQAVGTLFLIISVILPTTGFTQSLAEATPESVGSIEIFPDEDPTSRGRFQETPELIDSFEVTEEPIPEHTPDAVPNETITTATEKSAPESTETPPAVIATLETTPALVAPTAGGTEVPAEESVPADESVTTSETVTPDVEDVTPTADTSPSPAPETPVVRSTIIPAASVSTLEVGPSTGPADTEVSLTGAGFEPNEVITIRWNSSTDGDVLHNNLTATEDGDFRVDVLIPTSAAPDEYSIFAVGTTGSEAHASFTVTESIDPVITLSHNSGPAGAAITLTGQHFGPGEQIPLWWGDTNDVTGVWLGDAGTREDGTFRVDIETPDLAESGDYTIYAVPENGSTAETQFQVTAHAVSVNISEGTPGANIVVSGEGLLPGDEFTIKWDSIFAWPLVSGTVSSDGTFSATLQVPTDAMVGPATIYVQSVRLQFDLRFEVTANQQEATMSISPTSGRQGDRLRVVGTNFTTGERVNIRWGSVGGPILGYKNATSNGAFSGAMLVPKDATTGMHSIYLQSTSHTTSSSFTVTEPPLATVAVSPDSGRPGDRIVVTGTNFKPGDRVNIRWGSSTGPILGYKDATATSVFSGVMLVPVYAETGINSIYLQSESVTAFAEFTVTAPPAATVSISPASGLPGDRVGIVGHNFAPGERVNIRWGSSTGPILGYKNSGSTGSLSGAILVPVGARSGTHTIYLQSTSATASVPFTVTSPPSPTTSVSPTSGKHGDRLTVSGKNFTPGVRVNIRWGSSTGPILGYKNAYSNGSFSGAILVPANASAGSTKIHLQSASGTTSVSFSVTVPPAPTIAVSPTSGLPGARLSVSGTNFKPGERVNIRWGSANGPILGYKNATATGAIAGAILVPANASSGTTRIYLQSASGTTSAVFTVNPKPKANVSLDYNWGTYGDIVAIQGWNFQPGETVTISFPGNRVVGRVTVRSDGTFSGRIMVPTSAAIGYNTITSRGGNSGSSAGIRYRVYDYLTTEVAVSPRALPGAVIEFAGQYFRPGEVITVYWSDLSVRGRVVARADGTISGLVMVPTTALAGIHTVAFSNNDATYIGVTSITVIPYTTPTISAPASASRGARILITGSGFGPNEWVGVGELYRNTFIGEILTNPDGTFSGYAYLPWNIWGTTRLAAVGVTTERYGIHDMHVGYYASHRDVPRNEFAQRPPEFYQTLS